MKALRFNITQTSGGLFYTPANDEAKAILPKGRKALKSFEVCKAIEQGNKVELNLNPYLGQSFWVTLTSTNLPTNPQPTTHQ